MRDTQRGAGQVGETVLAGRWRWWARARESFGRASWEERGALLAMVVLAVLAACSLLAAAPLFVPLWLMAYAGGLIATCWRLRYERAGALAGPSLPLPTRLLSVATVLALLGGACELGLASDQSAADTLAALLRAGVAALYVSTLLDVGIASAVAGAASSLGRLPAWLRSREVAYVTMIVASAFNVVFHARLAGWDDSERVWISMAAAVSILWCRTLWKPGHAFWTRWMPHVGSWWTVAVVLALHGGGAPDGSLVLMTWIGALLAVVPGALYWCAQALRRRVVQPLAAERRVSRPGSVALYRDVHGQLARLIETIERTDAGVFGLTGVRGAGKSSLARRALHELAPRYFTLEVTSPARHDGDLGFFLGICRAVAQRVRDDLRPSFDPQPGLAGLLARRIRGAALVLLALVAAVAWGSGQAYDWVPSLAGGGKTPLDQLSVDASAEEWEAAMIAQLQARIESVLAGVRGDDPARAGWRFLVVPFPVGPFEMGLTTDFLVLPVRADDDHQLTLAELLAGKRFGDLYSRDGVLTWSRRSDARPVGFAATYARGIARLVGAGGSACSLQPLPPTDLLRCAAFEAAGEPVALWAVGLGQVPAAPSGVRLAFDVAELRQLQELLEHYRMSLAAYTWGAQPNSPAASAALPLGLPALPRAEPSELIRNPRSCIFWGSAIGLLLLALLGLFWSRTARLLRSLVNGYDYVLYQEAGVFLEELAFSASRESSQGFELHGLSLGAKRTLADRSLTLPGLTARYQRFVRRLTEHYNGKLVVAIDELDKVHDLIQVQALLAEIKGALFMPGTYYLVSIAEDAASAFRHRLTSGRDIFESTFDEIIEVPAMHLDAAHSVLSARASQGALGAAPLDPDLLWVPAVLGGGVPREMLRSLRALHLLQPATPADACAQLLARDMSEWISHLAESKLAGDGVILTRQYAIRAQAAIQRGDLDTAYGELRVCLSVIDPTVVRGSAKSLDLVSQDEPAESLAARTYAALAHDIQSCVRLQLVVTVGALVVGGALVSAFGPRVLEVYAALVKKPALAETLLESLRAEYGLAPASGPVEVQAADVG